MKIKLLLIAVVSWSFAAFLFGLTASAADEGKNKSKVTFTKDIAPIFQKSCETCHRPGGVAPMSLTTYEEARPWARSIKEKVVHRLMPPFSAAGPIGYYTNDPRLTDEQVAAITSWVDGGSPKGNPADMPKPLVWKDEQWQDGNPDLVLTMKTPYTLKPESKDDYQLFELNHVFAEETWLRGVVIRPGNRRAVHHATMYILPENLKAGPDGRIDTNDVNVRGGIVFAIWVPGSNPRLQPAGYGAPIPKGTRFGIQVHYAPLGEAVTDQTSVGFYFANGLIKKQNRLLYGGTDQIEIPAGAENHQIIQKRKFRTDAVVRGFTAHMHLRGKSFVVRFVYPDGKVVTPFEIPRYNFNWQRAYRLNEAIQVPKGTIAEYIATFDNSAKNPYNPDPTQVVRFGPNTTDEMMSGSIFYIIPDENLNFWVKNGLRVQPPDAAAAAVSSKEQK